MHIHNLHHFYSFQNPSHSTQLFIEFKLILRYCKHAVDVSRLPNYLSN